MGGLRSRVGPVVRSMPVLERYPTTWVASGIDGFRLRHEFESVRTFVLFVGQPRTGHSLVGALLDAHPRALVAHELDALKYVAVGYDRRRLYSLLVRKEQKRIAQGHVSGTGYGYAVPGQWQGRYQRLEVIGDKKGGRSTMRLGDDIGLLRRLEDTVGVEVRIIRVVRNPYDVIATMHRRAPKRGFVSLVDLFFALEETVDVVRDQVGPRRFHELHLDDLIADPNGALREICQFLDLSAPADYLDACRRVVFDAPSRTRDRAPWTPELLRRVAAGSAEHAALTRYHFDDATAPAERSG